MPFIDLDLGLDPLQGFKKQQPAKPKEAPEYRKPLSPEEESSIGGKILGAGGSGVSHVLGVLDKPGQAVRGVLAGKGASALKNLVPFSDTTGLTTEKDHTTGRNLTDAYGITNKRDKGWGAWGAGLAADLATDPLSYATFGAKHALTGAGKAVQATGALRGWTGKQMLQGFDATAEGLARTGNTASDISHMADQGKRIASGAVEATGVQAGQPLSSLARFAIPFGGPSINVGTGKMSQAIAGGLDAAGEWAKYGNPVGRAVNSLFDSRVHGAVDRITQKGAAQYLDPALTDLSRQARGDRYDLISRLDPLVSAPGADETAITTGVRSVAEGLGGTAGLPQGVADVGAQVRGVGQRQLGEARAAGAPIKDLEDKYADYVHRSALAEHAGSTQLGGRPSKGELFPVTSGANFARDEVLRDVPGGTARINDWYNRFAGDKASHPSAIEAAIRADMTADFVATGKMMSPDISKELTEKSKALAERLVGANPIHRTTADQVGRPFFSPDIVSDVTQRGRQHAKTVSSARAATGTLADNARPMTDGLIPLSDVAKRLGLETTLDASGNVAEGALVNLYRGLAKHGAGKVDPFVGKSSGALERAVNQFGVTPEHAEQILKGYQGWNAPEQVKTSLGAFDSITNAFKALAYPIWLPSHVRNAGTAAVNNARHGVGIQDYVAQLQAMTGRGARDLSSIHPSLAGLPPKDQADALRRMQYSAGNVFGGHGMNEEIAGNALEGFNEGKRFTPRLPGSDRTGTTGSLVGDTLNLTVRQGLGGSVGAAAKAVKQGLGGLFDKNRSWGQSIGENFGIRGVGGAAKDTLPAVKAGRAVGTNVEDFFRGALMNKLIREGKDPSVAADAMNALHFDYDALTGFEKNVMRRAMPFYSYLRKNLPLQVDTMLHSPGVIQAQGKPFRQQDGDSKGYVPEYLDSGLAFGLGPEVDGKRQYVSKLGLPMEEAFERLHFKGGLPDVRRTALSYLGGMNPLVKGPIEQLFDTQFHTQRKLSDLRAPAAASEIGKLWNDDNPQVLSQILSNSPLTRFVTSADKMLDPRKTFGQKALNMLSGVKVTDVDVEKQRAIDLRNALNEQLKGRRNISPYTSFYVKPDDKANLTADDVELLRLYAEQQRAAQAYAKSQRIGVR